MRKQCRRKIYQLVDCVAHAIAGAAITTDDCLDQLKAKESAAIEAMRTGNATVYIWQELVDMNNICQVMARNGIGPEALVDCMIAEIELKSAAKRFEATGRMLLTGPGLRAIQEVSEWHQLQRTSISRSAYERMIQKTRNKIRSRSKDVTVIIGTGESTMKFSINEAQENIIGEFAMCLLNAVTAAHIHHFGTDSYAQHVALREFYEGIEDLADKFIEAYQGKKSKIIFAEKALFLEENGLELVLYVGTEIAKYRQMPGFPQDSDLQNIVDELSGQVASTLYKLRFLK